MKADNIAGAVAARWLKLSQDERDRTGVMAPSHELREGINAHIRERLVREGRIAGPALETQRLVSKGYTNAEKTLVSNYAPGDVVAFHRAYKRLGVAKGDERRVERVERKGRTAISKARTAGASPGSRRRSAGAGAGPRSTGPRLSSSARATASGGRATTPASGSSTAARPKS